MYELTVRCLAASGLIGCMLAAPLAHANPVLPCTTNRYGTQAEQIAIENAMFSGTAAQVQTAITNARNTRGDQVGCAEAAYPAGNFPSNTEPSLSTAASKWNTVHSPGLTITYPMSSTYNCPRIGRMEPAAALGAWYARLAGYSTTSAMLGQLRNIADKLEGTQSTTANFGGGMPSGVARGMYGYVNVPTTDTCYLGGVQGSGVAAICSNASTSQLCVTYTGGGWSGREFLIGDQLGASFKDGGGAFDHGIAGVMMIEAYLAHKNDPVRGPKYLSSIQSAVNWAKAEYPVRNHNYTAKLIWFLAQAYSLTGDPSIKTNLKDKLDRNLKLAPLIDANADGNVDGMSSRPFSTLAPAALTPGRSWDAHNALPWYHGMNSWAMLEAYVAFRDRGDTAEANNLRPYVITMLDNLAREVNTYGLLPGSIGTPELGMTQMMFALSLGLWKFAEYEGSVQNDWKTAAAMLWNRGMVNSYGSYNTMVAGTYLLYRSNVPYQPLWNR